LKREVENLISAKGDYQKIIEGNPFEVSKIYKIVKQDEHGNEYLDSDELIKVYNIIVLLYSWKGIGLQ